MTYLSEAKLPPLIGQSPPFLEVMERASVAAPLDRPVLIVGERGTGKELIAARLHYLSGRWQHPFVTVNCAALPETLLETELFGHEAGAFTGAVRRRIGRFERANGGTLFLDEIATASLAVQEKLLRLVEYGQFERLGSSATMNCDVRMVAAANVDLPAMAQHGAFRHDLLDRLSFEVLTVPPLRERPGDISVLADFFARAMAIELGWGGFPGFSPGALEELTAYVWPGNVRELKNVVERSVYRWREETSPVGSVLIDPFASPYRLCATTTVKPVTPKAEEAVSPKTSAANLDDAVAEFEHRLLVDALREARYNQRLAADRAGLAYHQFRSRLRRHGLIGMDRDNG